MGIYAQPTNATTSRNYAPLWPLIYPLLKALIRSSFSDRIVAFKGVEGGADSLEFASETDLKKSYRNTSWHLVGQRDSKKYVQWHNIDLRAHTELALQKPDHSKLQAG